MRHRKRMISVLNGAAKAPFDLRKYQTHTYKAIAIL